VKRLSLVLALLLTLVASNAMAFMYVSVYDSTIGGDEWTYSASETPTSDFAAGITIDTGLAPGDIDLSDWSLAFGAVYGFTSTQVFDPVTWDEVTTYNYVASYNALTPANLKFAAVPEQGDIAPIENIENGKPGTTGAKVAKSSFTSYFSKMGGLGYLNNFYGDSDAELNLAADGSASGKLISGTFIRTQNFITSEATYEHIMNDMVDLDFFVENETLHIGTSAAAGPVVPVPAAVWLLGSGLLGLFGIRKKINA